MARSISLQRILLVAIVVAVISGASGFTLADYLASREVARRETYIRNAVYFLTNIQFNPELNLTREGTTGNLTRTYWLLSDNLIASKALWQHNATVSSRIQNTLTSFGYLKNNLHETLFGFTIPTPPKESSVVVVRNVTSYTIKVELHLGVPLAYQEYADLLVYAALNFQWLGNRSNAVAMFNKAVMMWDGKGVSDSAFFVQPEYQTYKLALVLYASKVLNIPLQYEREMRDRMWAMQRPDGGLWTGYDASLRAVSADANTETTALAILAGS